MIVRVVIANGQAVFFDHKANRVIQREAYRWPLTARMGADIVACFDATVTEDEIQLGDRVQP